jgi:hypothetical protein
MPAGNLGISGMVVMVFGFSDSTTFRFQKIIFSLRLGVSASRFVGGGALILNRANEKLPFSVYNLRPACLRRLSV